MKTTVENLLQEADIYVSYHQHEQAMQNLKWIEGEIAKHPELLDDPEFSRRYLKLKKNLNVTDKVKPETFTEPNLNNVTVWFGSWPESCGRENWTVILRRKTAPVDASAIERHTLMSGFTVCRSEYKDRMRYEADRLRFLLGEITVKPDIRDYDSDLRSDYVPPPDPRDAVIEKCKQTIESFLSDPSVGMSAEFKTILKMIEDLKR